MTMVSRRTRRKFVNAIVLLLSWAAAAAGLLMLTWILSDTMLKGFSAINWDFFTKLPAPPGEAHGGLANAVVGTLILTGTATILSVPFGVLAGIYLAEFGRGSKPAALVRLVADVLTSAPSIVVGVFVYLILVRPLGHFSGWAGAVALAILMLPVVTRTTEEMLNLVPAAMREAALALGAPYWRMVLQVVLRAAMSGMLTGILLSVSRVAGETAPLLFTSLNSPYWANNLNRPMPSLTVTLFNYAMSPYDEWHTLAWGAAFVITAAILVFTLAARLFLRTAKRERS